MEVFNVAYPSDSRDNEVPSESTAHAVYTAPPSADDVPSAASSDEPPISTEQAPNPRIVRQFRLPSASTSTELLESDTEDAVASVAMLRFKVKKLWLVWREPFTLNTTRCYIDPTTIPTRARVRRLLTTPRHLHQRQRPSRRTRYRNIIDPT